MKYLLIPFLALSILSCEPASVGESCDIKVLENGRKWKTFDCSHSVLLENTWSMNFKAKPISNKDFHHQSLFFRKIPTEMGVHTPYSKIDNDGQSAYNFLNTEEGFFAGRYDWHEDVLTNFHLLDTLATNYLRIDSYDEETGMITGGFHTEWLKQNVNGDGPDRQILHCDHFEFQLDQREPVK